MCAYLSEPVNSISGDYNVTILPDCSIHSAFDISSIAADRVDSLSYSFELRNYSTGSVIESQDNLSLPEVAFSHTFQMGVCYQLSFAVNNCAGMTSYQSIHSILPGD